LSQCYVKRIFIKTIEVGVAVS